MDKGIFAVLEHRKLMELKNSGAVDFTALESRADAVFIEVRDKIRDVRKLGKKKGFFSRLMMDMTVDEEVALMFPERKDLVDHLTAVDVPTDLCPITEYDKERLLFIDRASRYSVEAQKILDMFRRHHEVIVDSDRSQVVEWIIQNNVRIRNMIAQGE